MYITNFKCTIYLNFCALLISYVRITEIIVHAMSNLFHPERPNNDLPLLPPKVDFRDSDILIELNSANVALGKLNEEFARIPNQQLLLEFVSIKE